MTIPNALSRSESRDEPLSPQAVELRRRNAIRLNLGRFLRQHSHIGGRPWTGKEPALLSTNHDERIAERIRRMATAVRL